MNCTLLRWLLPILVIALALAACLAYFVPAPVHYFDEGGNLANALAVIGISSDADNHYYFGYPLFIAPLLILAEEAQVAFRLVQLTNLSLYATTCFLIAMIGWQLRKSSGSERQSTFSYFTMAACLYPPLIFFATMTWSENLIYLLIPAICFFLLDYVKTNSRRSIIVLAITAGFASWVHPRLFPTLIALTMVLFFVNWKKGTLIHFFLYVTIVTFSLAAYQLAIHPYFESVRMPFLSPAAEANYVSAGTIASLLALDLSDITHLLARISGQIAIFNINGFFLPGMISAKIIYIFLFSRSQQPSAKDRTAAPVVSFLLLSMIGVVFAAALLFQLSLSGDASHLPSGMQSQSFNNRIDHWIYSRYIDVFIPLFLLFSAPYLERKFLLISVLVTLFFSALVVTLAPESMATPNYINIQALWPYHILAMLQPQNYVGIDYLAILLALAIVANFAVSYVFINNKALPICLITIFLGTTFLNLKETKEHDKWGLARYQFGSIMKENLAPDDCIYADTASFTIPHSMYAFLLRPNRIVALNRESESERCKGLITMQPNNFDSSHNRITVPTDGFLGMIQKQ